MTSAVPISSARRSPAPSLVSDMPGPFNLERLVDTIFELDPDVIDPLPDQPRTFFDQRKLQLLAHSMKNEGQKQPVPVRPKLDGRFELADGERRWRAAQLGGLKLRVFLVPPVDHAEAIEDAMIANLHREPHTVLEKAYAVKYLKTQRRFTLQEIALKLGLSLGTITNLLLILEKITPPVLELMDPSRNERPLLYTFALELTPFSEHPEEQLRLAREILDGRMTLHRARSYISRYASKLGITTGRGRERRPSDHHENLRTAMHSLGSKLTPFLGMKQADFDAMFANIPGYEHDATLKLVENRLREIEKIRNFLKNVEGAGCSK